MNYDQFVGEVQHKARLSSNGEAVAVIRATLGTLAERLTPGAAENLAAQLPPEIGHFLQTSNHAERFSIDQFAHRIAERTGAPPKEAIFHARAVLDVLRGAVTEGQLDKVLAQLPDEWDQLLTADAEGELRIDARRD